jgi:hypothetical protein
MPTSCPDQSKRTTEEAKDQQPQQTPHHQEDHHHTEEQHRKKPKTRRPSWSSYEYGQPQPSSRNWPSWRPNSSVYKVNPSLNPAPSSQGKKWGITSLSNKSINFPNFLFRNPQSNRYRDVLCCETNRVKLNNGKYIHANWIEATNGERRFICTQGPLAQTTEDFWNLVIQEKVEAVVMLCNTVELNRPKCHQYWPEKEGEEVGF